MPRISKRISKGITAKRLGHSSEGDKGEKHFQLSAVSIEAALIKTVNPEYSSNTTFCSVPIWYYASISVMSRP